MDGPAACPDARALSAAADLAEVVAEDSLAWPNNAGGEMLQRLSKAVSEVSRRRVSESESRAGREGVDCSCSCK